MRKPVSIARFAVRGYDSLLIKVFGSEKEAKSYVMEMEPSERRGVSIIQL